MKKLTENIIQQRLKTCTTDLDKVLQINVTGRELKDVSLLRKMTGVEILSLSVNQISGLADFQDCKNLRELYLRHNKISDINEIFYLKNLPKLELLMLSQNPCVENPLYRMTVIKNLKNLTELDGVPITPEERKRAKTLGAEVFQTGESIEPAENCVPDSPQVHRTSFQSTQKVKHSGEYVTEPEFKASKTVEKLEAVEVSARNANESNVKTTASTQLDTKKGKQQSPKSKKKNIPQNCDTLSVGASSCKMCENSGTESTNPLAIAPKNSNILSATLNLIKKLDYSSLQIINAEVGCRINAFETDCTCQCHTFSNRNGNVKENMNVKPYT